MHPQKGGEMWHWGDGAEELRLRTCGFAKLSVMAHAFPTPFVMWRLPLSGCQAESFSLPLESRLPCDVLCSGDAAGVAMAGFMPQHRGRWFAFPPSLFRIPLTYNDTSPRLALWRTRNHATQCQVRPEGPGHV